MTRFQQFSVAAIGVLASVAGPVLPQPALAQGVVSEWASVKPPPVPELKTVTLDPLKTAILVVDFSDGCARNPRWVAAIPKVKDLLARARARPMLVVYTAYGRMKQLAELGPVAGEQTIMGRANKFADTEPARTRS